MSETTWKINVDTWRVKHLRRWQEAVNSMSYAELFSLMSETIEQWPFENDPAKVESYDELRLSELTEVVKQVSAAITAMFQK